MATDGNALLQQAEKLQSGAGGGGFSFFGSKSDKWEQASDKFR
jgi:hypothetical protein